MRAIVGQQVILDGPIHQSLSFLLFPTLFTSLSLCSSVLCVFQCFFFFFCQQNKFPFSFKLHKKSNINFRHVRYKLFQATKNYCFLNLLSDSMPLSRKNCFSSMIYYYFQFNPLLHLLFASLFFICKHKALLDQKNSVNTSGIIWQ